MLEHYFRKVATLDQIRSLWLGSAISRYAEWLSDRQMSHANVLFKIQTIRMFDRFAASEGMRDVAALPSLIEPFIETWTRTRGTKSLSKAYLKQVRSAPRSTVEEFLRLAVPGFTGTDRRLQWPLQELLPGFRDYLVSERGLRPDTLMQYRHHLSALQGFLRIREITDLARFTPALINRFLSETTQHVAWGTRQGRAGVLRVVLRYAHRQGIVLTDLSRAVPRGRTYKQAAIPRAVPWSDIERSLSCVDRRDAYGKRDYAILMLLATYGMRSQEVALMELSAIDWTRSRFHVVGRKAGNSTTYPLSSAVGEAIIDYLRHGRPKSTDRHLFVTHRAPFHAVAHWAVSGRASHYLQIAGVKVSRAGSHTFRHSCVQRLVEADVPFKQIRDYVGHRSEESTQVYAKVAIHKLRALSMGDAEDML